MHLSEATPSDLPAIQALLTSLQLPAEDVGAPHQRFLVARAGGEVVGCVGLERHGRAALLRSLAVAPPHRQRGLGRELHRRALALAAETGAAELFLLTTTAQAFFAREGYAPVDRSSAPESMRASPEFASLCPSTAACLARRMATGG